MKENRSWAGIFVGPAVLLIATYLIYPTLVTVYLSFFDRRSEGFVGFANYVEVFKSQAIMSAFQNNLLWLVTFTTATVGLGLVMAVLTDRVRYEAVAKSIVFMPMAISFAGAGVIWRFVYTYRPMGDEQIGVLNQVVTWLGYEPIAWLIERPWINNFALIAVGTWMWTGFCMVILSAAYKGIPRDIMEAARVDGAGEWKLFWHVSFPHLKSTVAVVSTTMVITVLKVFDIVYVMTNGNYNTEVVANRMYKEMFQFRHFGRASALAVLLFIAILPFIVTSLRQHRRQLSGNKTRRTLRAERRTRGRSIDSKISSIGRS